ncbi:pyridoxal-phosphate dependent enzyme [Kineosporia succinea]|uniref:D-cysteine desulfhydrase n=1 Tax=Kineosporia succinea TaxID=84632 RepID=A0ABT9NXB5_9ACTN|nr:pyridoxal-phosphate dependent enzyme [Kineosporia succinea]MDP9825067.1 D-cysteine desulfhydrase [Kineosporia succinea]
MLATYPTPLDPAPRLAEAIGLNPGDLYVKRDDLIGLGGGGNKVRKLEHTVRQALDRRATVLVTSGAAQSNHARLTAAAAAKAGLRAVLVLEGHETPAVGNLLLDRLFGAEIVWAGDLRPADLGERVRAEAERLTGLGERAEVIPFGGSSVLGAKGYEECGHELRQQLPDLHTVVTALGSGGTMAGLVRALGPGKVYGVDVGAVPDPRAVVAALLPDPGIDLRIRAAAGAYGVLAPAVKEAMTLVARTEGIVLDPVYTGRAAAGLVEAVREGLIEPGRTTVLLHSGGLPGLFGHPEASEIYV